MTRTRHILAVTLVATALCADRAVAAAAPSVQPDRSESRAESFASRIVRKLSHNFQRVVPAMRLCQTSCSQVVPDTKPAAPLAPLAVHQPLNAFEFRLPPPAL